MNIIFLILFETVTICVCFFFVFRFPTQRWRSVNKNYALERYKEHWFKTKEGRFYTPNSTQDRTLWNNRKKKSFEVNILTQANILQ